MFGLGLLYYVLVLLVNAAAILSQDRFLERIGWTVGAENQGFGSASNEPSIKRKLLELIGSIRTFLRPVLIGLNLTIIIYELILG